MYFLVESNHKFNIKISVAFYHNYNFERLKYMTPSSFYYIIYILSTRLAIGIV